MKFQPTQAQLEIVRQLAGDQIQEDEFLGDDQDVAILITQVCRKMLAVGVPLYVCYMTEQQSGCFDGDFEAYKAWAVKQPEYMGQS